MDKLLRDIQVELLPGREPAPPLAAPAPAPAPPAGQAQTPTLVATTAAPEPATAAPEPATAAPEPATATPEPATAATAPTATAPPPTPDPDPELRALTELSTRLLASMRELLVGYERVLVGPSSPQTPGRRASPRRPGAADVTLSAGPFPSLDALREFELAVSSLPGVREVAVRGYEGADRAIIEVRLHRQGPGARPDGRNP
jgi:hypothetical protein